VHETCVGVFKTNFESQMSRRITNLASRNVVGYVPTHLKSNCADIFHFLKLFLWYQCPTFLVVTFCSLDSKSFTKSLFDNLRM